MLRPTGQAVSLPFANIVAGHYRYTEELLQLSSVSTSHASYGWPRYHTPIQIDSLLPFLMSHPDKAFAAYIHEGLTNGFRIGYSHAHSRLFSRGSNHPSALAQESVVQEKIAIELRAERLFGPLPGEKLPVVHLSPLALIPKAHTTKWRMIVDLPIAASTMAFIQIFAHSATPQCVMQSASSRN